MNAEAIARELVRRESLIAHEAGHAAAAILLGRRVREIRVVDVPEPDAAGIVRFHEVYDFTPEVARRCGLCVLAGGLHAGDPYWPPKWSLVECGLVVDDDPLASDARCMNRVASYLHLDEEGWRQLVKDAHTLVCRRDFGLLAHGIEYALTQLGAIDSEEFETFFGPEFRAKHDIATEEELTLAA